MRLECKAFVKHGWVAKLKENERKEEEKEGRKEGRKEDKEKERKRKSALYGLVCRYVTFYELFENFEPPRTAHIRNTVLDDRATVRRDDFLFHRVSTQSSTIFINKSSKIRVCKSNF